MRRGMLECMMAAVLLVLGTAGAVWFWPPSMSGAAGVPRLAVDRGEIDLGDQPFGRRVRASFTLTNTGSGPLTLDAAPPVRALEGC